ncbi:MAG: hypothetical protein WBJ10_17040 [Daejeonella sp.]|uniref:hypothetical protein n=1 Tax=Daejeonella sp. TaxID=2805397 RepID=UPI003C729E20
MNEKSKVTERIAEDTEFVVLNLNKSQEQIKSESGWLNGDRNAMTLFKSDGLRIVLMALHTEAELKSA